MDGITDPIDMNLSKLRETVEDRGAWRAVDPRIKQDLVTKQEAVRVVPS